MTNHIAVTIQALRRLHEAIENFLSRGRANLHKGMWQAAPGVWVSGDFKTLDEAMEWLSSTLST